jgi:hypothetical protein
MTMIEVPVIPEALGFMLDPPQGKIRAVSLLKVLNQCSIKHGLCRDCQVAKTCRNYYDFVIDTDMITNWHGGKVNVARYFE